MPQQVVETADGNRKVVIADNDADLKDAVKAAKSDAAPVYPNINHPVQKGHDLVAVGEDASKVLVDGTGAHNSPQNAIDDNGKVNGEGAAGLEEASYKSVPEGGNQEVESRTASKSEVSSAKKEAEPANDELAVRTANKKSSK
jgi:hypothetical protein